MDNFNELTRAMQMSQRILFNALSVSELRYMQKELNDMIEETIERKVSNGDFDPGRKP